MFSNKYFRLKLGGALAVIALLGVYAAREGDPINPQVWRCVAEPERWHNTTIWVPRAIILSIRDADFELDTGETRIRVAGPAPGKVGDPVSVYGIFRADGVRLDLVRGRVLPPHHRLRWLMEAVSVLVVLAILVNFARHFLFRPKILQVESPP
jgi:hypothetical protein